MFVSVDLPIPGEPPSSTSEPGTSPPPSTRSSSPMPVDMRSHRRRLRLSRAGAAVARRDAGAPPPLRRFGSRAPATARARAARLSASASTRRAPRRACSRPRSPGTAVPLRGLEAALRAGSGRSCRSGHWHRQRYGPAGDAPSGPLAVAQHCPRPRMAHRLVERTRPDARGCGAHTAHVAPAPVGHLADAAARAHELEAAALVQGDRGVVLGEDAGLERPEPGALGRLDQRPEQRAADAAPRERGVDVDAHLAPRPDRPRARSRG